MGSSDGVCEGFVYRICTGEEWEAMQKRGISFGREVDAASGYMHLSMLNQVGSTLEKFFMKFHKDLFLLQIDAKKLGDGLIYEAVDDTNVFPHFYGPSRSFSPLPLDAVVKSEQLVMSEGKFRCSLLS
ncbi:hypothetical protein DM860_018194 [Cuscuta australis]|uniref:Uncharacterized protein n=1 Tax=Cuscuta australis TaxID=267555 RepID=A0A328DA23_9ASTE|nr:hypothetical protein DM860_018194 [Cuscuta australis]